MKISIAFLCLRAATRSQSKRCIRSLPWAVTRGKLPPASPRPGFTQAGQKLGAECATASSPCWHQRCWRWFVLLSVSAAAAPGPSQPVLSSRDKAFLLFPKAFLQHLVFLVSSLQSFPCLKERGCLPPTPFWVWTWLLRSALRAGDTRALTGAGLFRKRNRQGSSAPRFLSGC